MATEADSQVGARPKREVSEETGVDRVQGEDAVPDQLVSHFGDSAVDIDGEHLRANSKSGHFPYQSLKDFEEEGILE